MGCSMKRPPSKRETLELCIQMWDWLAENPRREKFEAVRILNMPQLDTDCAACEYDSWKFYTPSCGSCPVWEYKGCSTMCMDEEYGDWITAERENPDFEKVRIRAARRIASRARRKLEEL